MFIVKCFKKARERVVSNLECIIIIYFKLFI
jgi:hypothetical protein